MLAASFVGLRLELVAHRDASRFVVAGSNYAEPGEVPPSLHVEPGDGFDGQFVWRLAAAPNHLGVEPYLGVHLDSALRTQRIGLPVLAWGLAGGQVEWVPWALIAVNVAAVGLLGWFGALFARDAKRSPWLGLLLTCVPGFAFVISRDLNELLAAALLVAGMYAVQRRRWWWAAAAWSAGVLTREQLLLAVAGYGLWRVTQIVRRTSSPGTPDAPWVAAALSFVAWQATVWFSTGVVPLRSDTGVNLSAPLLGIGHGVLHWYGNLGAKAAALTLMELVLLVALVATALATPARRECGWQRWILVVLSAFALVLSSFVWDTPADLRTVTDLAVVAWVVLLTAGPARALRWLGGSQVLLFAGAASLRLAAI